MAEQTETTAVPGRRFRFAQIAQWFAAAADQSVLEACAGASQQKSNSIWKNRVFQQKMCGNYTPENSTETDKKVHKSKNVFWQIL